MTLFTTIDLSALPEPDVIEVYSFEQIIADIKADFVTRYPEFTADLESDPIIKLIETMALREGLLLQRINDAARAVLVAKAIGADLDNIAAFFGVSRLVGETDDRLRRRVVLAPESYSTAGSEGAYQFHSLTADVTIKDVSVTQTKPGYILVSLMSEAGQGVATVSSIAVVQSQLSSDTVRPLTDVVSVRSISIVTYSVKAELWLYPGPDANTVLAASLKALQAYVDEQHVIGRDITMSGLYAALQQIGVQRVVISSPSVDIVVSSLQTAFCLSVDVRVAGRDE